MGNLATCPDCGKTMTARGLSGHKRIVHTSGRGGMAEPLRKKDATSAGGSSDRSSGGPRTHEDAPSGSLDPPDDSASVGEPAGHATDGGEPDPSSAPSSTSDDPATTDDGVVDTKPAKPVKKPPRKVPAKPKKVRPERRDKPPGSRPEPPKKRGGTKFSRWYMRHADAD